MKESKKIYQTEYSEATDDARVDALNYGQEQAFQQLSEDITAQLIAANHAVITIKNISNNLRC